MLENKLIFYRNLYMLNIKHLLMDKGYALCCLKCPIIKNSFYLVSFREFGAWNVLYQKNCAIFDLFSSKFLILSLLQKNCGECGQSSDTL